MAPLDFPIGRFRLALIEPLLGDLLYLSLDEPMMSIGLKKSAGGSILPFVDMELQQLLEVIPESIQDRPLAQLRYNFCSAGYWLVEYTAHDDSACNVDQPCRKLTLNAGDLFHIHLPANWGFFRFMLVDQQKVAATTHCRGQKMGTPGFQGSKISMLPHIPLQMIAGYLGPRQCLESLMIADPLVIPKLMKSVPGASFSFRPHHAGMKILDVFRMLRLLSRDSVKKLEILRDHLDILEPAVEHLLRDLSGFLTGARLEEVQVSYDYLKLFKRPNKATKKLEILACVPPADTGSIWPKLASLPLSKSTEVSLNLDEACADGDPRVHQCGIENLLMVTSPLTNVTEITWAGCQHAPVPPFEFLPKLKKISGRGCGLQQNEAYVSRLVSNLSRASLQDLKEVSLTLGIPFIKRTIEALVLAAPNIVKLTCCVLVTNERSGDQHLLEDLRNMPDVLTNLDSVKKLDSLSSFSLMLSHSSLAVGKDVGVGVEEAIELFLNFKHVPTVQLGSVSSFCPVSFFLRQFEDLKDLGKIIEVAFDPDFTVDSDCYCDISDEVSDFSGSCCSEDDERGEVDMNMADDHVPISHLHCFDCHVSYIVVVRNPAADAPEGFEYAFRW